MAVSDPPRGQGPAGNGQAGDDVEPAVDVHDAQGILIGDYGRQTNYFTVMAPVGTGDSARQGEAAFLGEVDSPYRGLLAFEERHAAFFFGRQGATEEILDRLSRQAGAPALLVVSGASGAGKSSLLQAGVLARIGEAGLAVAPEGTPWPHLVLTPARAPLSELAGHVAPLVSADAATLRQVLRADPSGFALTALDAAGARKDGGGRRRLLLVVDQFEQVFTQCGDESERRAFIAALHAAATTGHGPQQVPAAMVILVVRADFEARCADYGELVDAVQDRYLLPRMTELQLRLAITEPARVAGSAVDDALVGELVRAIGDASSPSGAGVLPHLSHALDQAWRNRAGDVLTLTDYERVGGIEGSIAASADRAFATLTPGRQEAARQVFTRLTAISADGTNTAGQASGAELAEAKNPAEVADVNAVLEAFATERLLTLTADSVELSHEALLTAWPLLHDWLAETYADRTFLTQLRTAVTEWQRHKYDRAYLYRGTLLHTANALVERARTDPARNLPLGQSERAFLRASSSARQRARRLLQAVIALLVTLTLTAITSAVVAANNATTASRNAATASRNAATAAQQHAIALSRQLAAQALSTDPTNPLVARQLAVAAWAVSNTSQAGSAMTDLLAEQEHEGALPASSSDQQPLEAVAFSADGKFLATASGNGPVRLWNPATQQPIGAPLNADTGYSLTGNEMAFSPNGDLLATAGSNGMVQLWNPATQQPIGAPLNTAAYTVGHDTVFGGPVVISADGKLLAVIVDGLVQLWDLATHQLISYTLDADHYVNGVAFSPDGKLLATADDDGRVRLWNTATQQPVGAPLNADTGSPVGVNGVVFSPDGKLLATVGNETVRLWNPATQQPIGAPLNAGAGPNGVINQVAFSPDGKLLATANSDGPVLLWNPATGQSIGAPLTTLDSYVVGVAFSPDGKFLATAERNGIVQVWNPATHQPIGAPLDAGNGLNDAPLQVAFSPDGGLLAAANEDGRVLRWNPATGQAVGAPLTADPTGIFGVAFSPSGKLLATADNDGTVGLWNPATGRAIGPPLPADTGSDGGVVGVAFSPSGKLLATADLDGSVMLWNPATGRAIGPPLPADIGPTRDEVGMAFSPNGKLLATVSHQDGFVLLWNPATGTGQVVPSPQLDVTVLVLGVAFSPNGRLLANADSDGTVALWDPATRQYIGTPLPVVPNGSVNAVAFSPGGNLLATADSDGTVRLLNPATGRLVGAPLPADLGGSVKAVAFSPDGSLLATADSNGTVQLWRVSLYTDPYRALCTDAGSPSRSVWQQYAGSEPLPKVCG